MPLRGETVGTAFVRILADGHDLPGSIKDEMERNGPIMEARGQKDSDTYTKAFEKEFKKSGTGRIDKALTEGIARSNAIEKLFTGPRWQKITRRLEKQYREVGLLIASNIEKGVRESGDIDVMARRLGNINREVILANKQIVAAMHEERDAFANAWTEAHRMNAELDVSVVKAKRLADAAEKVGKTQRTTFDKSLTGRIGAAGNELDKVGNKFGKALRARNNFFNAIGKGITGSIEGFARLLIFIGKVGQTFDSVGALFKPGGGGFGGLADMAKNSAGAVGKFATSLAGLAILIGLIIVSAGILTATLSGVAAAVTALTSSVVFGLIGALAPLIGLIAPLVIGFGTLALAISGQTKSNAANQKVLNAATQSVAKWRNEVKATTPGTKAHTDAVAKLAIALREQKAAQDTANKSIGGALTALKADFRDLQGVAGRALFANAPAQIAALRPVIASLRPLVSSTATAISEVFNGFLAGMNSKGFRDFAASMATFVPQALLSLGRIAEPVLSGIGSLFIALEPFTLRFLNAVERIARSFADWASSDKGRQQIKDFLEKAAKSALELWGLLVAVGGLLSTLLGGDAKSTGDDLITSLTNKVKEFTKWLKDNPNALKDWFANGKKIAKDLGDLAISIGKIADALDSPQNRRAASQFIHFMSVAMQAVSRAVGLLDLPFLSLIGTISFVAQHFNVIKSVASGVFQWVRDAIAGMVGGILAKFGSLLDGAVHAFGWIPKIGDALKGAQADFKRWSDSVTNNIRGVGGEIRKIAKPFVIDGILKIRIDAIGGAKMSAQARAKALEFAWSQLATGGPAFAGMPYLIGENGPELFIPNVSGMVVPNNDPAVQQLLKKGMTTTTNNTTITRGRSVDASGWTIVSNSEDPRAVARETLNTLVAAAI